MERRRDGDRKRSDERDCNSIAADTMARKRAISILFYSNSVKQHTCTCSRVVSLTFVSTRDVFLKYSKIVFSGKIDFFHRLQQRTESNPAFGWLHSDMQSSWTDLRSLAVVHAEEFLDVFLCVSLVEVNLLGDCSVWLCLCEH